MTVFTTRQMAGAFLALFCSLLLIPSANYGLFDGLPLSRLAEFLGLALVVPFVVSCAIRRLYGCFVRRLWRPARRGLLVLGVCAIGVKLVLLASGAHEGFLACYRSPVAPPPAGPCERSYKNPFFRFGVTRIDRWLDFTPASWDLSFFNSLRFNIYPWINGNVLRSRLPVNVTWSGTVEESADVMHEIRYAGAVTLELGSEEHVRLPPSYDSVAAARVQFPAGRYSLVIRYQFDDGSRVGDGRQHGPYATLSLVRVRGPVGEAAALASSGPAQTGRVAATLADAVVALFAATLASVLARAVARDPWLWVVAGMAALIGYYRDARVAPGAADTWSFPLLPALLVVILISRVRTRRLLSAYVLTFSAALFTAFAQFGRFDVVTYRAAGDDWLTYESFARSILETWSLRGAENVFYYQPLFRYIRFAEHLLLGDGDALVLTCAIVSLVWGCYWMCATAMGPRRRSLVRAATLHLASAFVLLWATSPTVIGFMRAGISEYPTWIALPLQLGLLLSSPSTARWFLGVALLGGSFLTRTNQLVGVLGILASFVWRVWPGRRHVAIAAGLLFGAIALLPGLHNYYYGRRIVPLTTSGSIPQNLVLPPAQWSGILHDAEVRSRARRQVERMLYITDRADPQLEMSIRGMQIMWAMVVGALLVGYRPGGLWVLLLSVPALYLIPHVVYQVAHGYPRHFLIGHLAMGLAVVLVVGQHRRFLPAR